MRECPILVGRTAVRLEEYFPTFLKHRSAFIFRVQRHIPDGLYLQQHRYNEIQFRINGFISDKLIFKTAKTKQILLNSYVSRQLFSKSVFPRKSRPALGPSLSPIQCTMGALFLG